MMTISDPVVYGDPFTNPFESLRKWPDRSGRPRVYPPRPWWDQPMHNLSGQPLAFRVDGAMVPYYEFGMLKPANGRYFTDEEAANVTWNLLGQCGTLFDLWCFVRDNDKTPLNVHIRRLIAAVDAANPLPCPPPIAGQVWRDYRKRRDLICLGPGRRRNAWHGRFITPDEPGAAIGITFSRKDFGEKEAVPVGMALLRGPGAPWADTREPLPWEVDGA